VKNLEEKITAESKVEAEIRSISKRIELIKRLGEQRKDYTELVVNTISLLGDGVGLEKSGFKENKVSLSVETQTPIEVSYLIDRYFEAKAADQITITSARLNKNTETYITDLEFE